MSICVCARLLSAANLPSSKIDIHVYHLKTINSFVLSNDRSDVTHPTCVNEA